MFIKRNLISFSIWIMGQGNRPWTKGLTKPDMDLDHNPYLYIHIKNFSKPRHRIRSYDIVDIYAMSRIQFLY